MPITRRETLPKSLISAVEEKKLLPHPVLVSMRLLTPNVVTNGFILESQRLFQAVAGDSEECSLGTAIHYKKIRGGGICDAFE